MQEKELALYILKALVDEPDGVSVNIIEGEQSTIMELRVRPRDVGKVIGKHGRIAQAIRTIITSAAMKTGRRMVVEILDSANDEHP
ncbi:MAG: KH domain-containing protein [Spirochaetota bacterium]|jgi:predicted RNA-binding protein YlqC (UPF0109 family)|nr:KH domain-containing protein [Spirochaetota bacterium]